MEAYCVKCKEKRSIKDPEPTFTSRGVPSTRGECPVCGTSLYRMGRTDAHEGMEAPEVKPRKSSKAIRREGKLVIVESPAKARTVGRYLGDDFKVRASVGHVRDLLKSKLSVDVDNDFEPRYRVPNEKRDVVKELKRETAKAKEIILATDPDREGEAIAWHLMEAAEIEPELARRVVFHEITKPAIEQAFEHPRAIDMNLVDAQQARRILDRLVGYNISPILWSKVRSGLSAGRVQSAALRLIVDREREIDAFVPEEYWSIEADFLQPDKPPQFRAKLAKIDERDPDLGSSEQVEPILQDMEGSAYQVRSVKRGTRRRKPPAPFITSTLQQEGSRRLNFSARKTMVIAQQLYEGLDTESGEIAGLITYMRTDSTQVSRQAQEAARSLIQQQYGKKYLPAKPPVYKKKTRGAQEAHEAIRPTSVSRTPQSVKPYLSSDQFKLYELIWQRFVGSQMKPALYDTLQVEIEGEGGERQYLLRVSTSSLRFPGFLAVYGDKRTGKGSRTKEDSIMEDLPDLQEGDSLELIELFPEQHFTQPPARFSDATLVKALEEYGIGRPSTYAPILTTLRKRGYIIREKRRLIPTDIGMLVNDLVVDHFPEVVDYGFTARLEDDLDQVAEGDRDWVELVRSFYEPFAERVERAEEQMPEVKPEPEEIGRACPNCGNPLILRHGRFGKFIGCSNYPECRHTEPWLDKIGVACPLDGGDLVKRRTRKGRTFYGCANYPDCEFTSWKRPIPVPCPECGGLMVQQSQDKVKCTDCERTFQQSEIGEPEADLA